GRGAPLHGAFGERREPGAHSSEALARRRAIPDIRASAASSIAPPAGRRRSSLPATLSLEDFGAAVMSGASRVPAAAVLINSADARVGAAAGVAAVALRHCAPAICAAKQRRRGING